MMYPGFVFLRLVYHTTIQSATISGALLPRHLREKLPVFILPQAHDIIRDLFLLLCLSHKNQSATISGALPPRHLREKHPVFILPPIYDVS